MIDSRRQYSLRAHKWFVYTGPDKCFHEQNVVCYTLRLHGTGGTGRIFERLSVQV